ncbi:hypothetical protein AN219_30785, partial [Streptomyces nanshensis]
MDGDGTEPGRGRDGAQARDGAQEWDGAQPFTQAQPLAQPQPFTQARARALLAAAGEQAEHAELLALGENAVFALPGPEPVVVRIGRGPSQLHRAERELRVAAWLEERQVPAVRPARTGVTV